MADNNRGAPIFGVGGTLLIALTVLFGVQPDSTVTPPATHAATAVVAASPDDGKTAAPAGNPAGDLGEEPQAEPYLEFRGITEQERRTRYHGWNLGKIIASDQREVAPQFLIATVPDPINSRFGYRFDAMVDSIQMAVESRGWNLDHFWMPWCPTGRQLGTHDALKVVLDPKSKVPLHEKYPGVMLFRRPRRPDEVDQRQRVLLVMLVGETPTTGVSKQPLEKCLEILETYYKSIYSGEGFRGPMPVDVRVVGPSFTGSEQSLAATLFAWLKRVPKHSPWSWNVFIRTGSADWVDKAKTERDSGNGIWPNVTVQFDATLIHLETVMKGLFGYLKKLNGDQPLGKVALLEESDTEYGNKLVREMVDDWSGPGTTVTTMKFPFHVSQVAVAYDENKRKEDRNTPTLVRPSSRLTIPFDETGNPRDTVPALSPAMTTATSEFVLSKILETISTENFRYIGIMASDTRDTIFLAGLIRQYCPDVQLFAPAGDLLLGHPRYAVELRGMLVGSSYPLFSMAQRWDPPYQGDRRRHLFSHQGDQGTFNAALSLLFARSEPARWRELTDMFEEEQNNIIRKVHAFFRPGADSLSSDFPSSLVQPRTPHRVPLSPALLPLAALSANVRSHIARYRNPNAPYFEALFDYGTPFEELSDLSLLWKYELRDSAPGKWTAPPDDYTAKGNWWKFIREDRVQPALWFDVVGQRGLWPVNFQRLESLEKRPAPASLDFVFNASYVSPFIDARQFAEQYLPLIPQFTWQWGGIYLGLSTMIWVFVLVQERQLTRRSRPTPILRLLMPVDRANAAPDPSRRWRRSDVVQREFFVAIGVVTLAVIYGYCVLWPCWIALLNSPWAEFFRPELWKLASSGDQWNLRFSWSALWLGHVTIVVLFFAEVRRLCFVAGRGQALSSKWLFGVPGVIALIGLVLAWQVRYWFEANWKYGTDVSTQFRDLLNFERIVIVSNGVSPISPILLLACLIGLFLWCQLHRLRLVGQFLGAPPASTSDATSLPPITRRARTLNRLLHMRQRFQRIERLLRNFLPRELLQPPVLVATAVMLVVLFRLRQFALPTPDFAKGQFWLISGLGFIMTMIWALAFAIVIALSRFMLLWQAIRAWLVSLARLPMISAFDRVPPLFSRAFGRYLDSPPPSLESFTIPVQQWAIVAEGFREVAPALELRYFDRTEAVSTVEMLSAEQRSHFAFLTRAITWHPTDIEEIDADSHVAQRICESFERELRASEIPEHITQSTGLLKLRSAARDVLLKGGRVEARRGLLSSLSGAVQQACPSHFEPGVGECGRQSWEHLVKLQRRWSSLLAHVDCADGACLETWHFAERVARSILDTIDPPASDDVARSATWRGLSDAALACFDLLDPYWTSREPAQGYADPPKADDKGAKAAGDAKPAEPTKLAAWVQAAENLVALQVVTHVSQCSIHLRNLAYFLAAAPILLLLTIASYPFQPQRFLLVCCWTVLLSVVAAVLWVYVQMERNEVLSRVAKTTPDRIAFDHTFITNILTFIVPLIGVVLAQFPFVADTVGQWLEPISRVLK